MINYRYKKYMLTLSVVSFISMVFLLLVVVWYIHDSILKERKNLIHSQVSTMMGLARILHNESLFGALSEQDAQTMFINYTSNLKYSKDGYFWMMSQDGEILTAPYQGIMLEQLLYNANLHTEKNLKQEILSIVNTGGGFIYYDWFASTESNYTKKLGYVDIFQPWGWVIGSGIYTDSLNYQIAFDILTGLIVISILFLLSVFVSLYLSRNYLSEFHQKAIYDPLTRLYTRGYLDEQGPRMLAQEKDLPFAVIFFDVDFFKKVNDEYGHKCGDEVLAVVSGIIQKELQPHKNIFRYGGEELIVLLNAPEESCRSFAENVRKTISNHHFSFRQNEAFHITVSAGIAVNQEQELFSDIVRRADRCMYFAKSRGRNQVITESEIREYLIE